MYNAYLCHSRIEAERTPPFAREDVHIMNEETEVSVRKVVGRHVTHHEYYPTGGGALYLAAQPEYKKRFLVFYYKNMHTFVVAWYYNRTCQASMCLEDVDEDWLSLWHQDTRINMNTTLLMARDASGHFIRGKVWMAAFGFPPTLQFDVYRDTPTCVYHGEGWNVPSTLLVPRNFVNAPQSRFRKVFKAPLFDDVASQSHVSFLSVKKPQPKSSKKGKKGRAAEAQKSKYRKRTEDRSINVPAIRLRYVPIAPKCGVTLPSAYVYCKNMQTL